jgi:hypothetical protein
MIGNHGWLGQYGVTKTVSSSSLIGFDKQNGIRQNGGKQNVPSPFHGKLKAPNFQNFCCGNQLTKRGSWWFHSDAKGPLRLATEGKWTWKLLEKVSNRPPR